MTVFGDEFSKYSYCWLAENDLWLSMIDVKEECQRKGVLHRLLEDAKKGHSAVIIPTPSKVVRKTAEKHGYTMRNVMETTPSGRKETIVCLVWEAEKGG